MRQQKIETHHLRHAWVVEDGDLDDVRRLAVALETTFRTTWKGNFEIDKDGD